MTPIDASALTTIFAWVWSQYGKTITDKTVKATWERLRWEDRALAYAQKMQRLYGSMQILGQAKPVPLEGIYTAVSLLDKPTAWRRYSIEEMQADFSGQGGRYFHAGSNEQRRDGLDMVRSGENLFILGKPGAGKTTFLKHVALRGVNGQLGECVPIFVGLKQLADSGKPVFDYIVEQFDICEFPDAETYLERLLKSGKAILLFDGLDEVNVADEERDRLITDVESFTRKYDGCQRLITCRLAANDYSFENYTYVEMADFDEAQIREFVVKWFGRDKKQRETRELFLAELRKSDTQGLRDMARVPLLLALLCLAFKETGKLSTQRFDLYKEALSVLLKTWDDRKNIRRDDIYRVLSLKRRQQMLAEVAAKTYERAEYFIPESLLIGSFEDFVLRLPNAQQEVDGEDVLKAIVAQHGLLTERARGIFSFAHLTLHEYFAAHHYVVASQALPRLIANYDDWRFQEVFLAVARQLPDASAFFDLFLGQLATDVMEHPEVVALLHDSVRRATISINEGLTSLTQSALVFYLILARNASPGAHMRDSSLLRALDFARARSLADIHSRPLLFALDLACALAHNLTPGLILQNTYTLARDRVRAELTPDPAIIHDDSILAFGVATDPTLIHNNAGNVARALAHVAYPTASRDTALIVARLCLRSCHPREAHRSESAGWLATANEFIKTAAIQTVKLKDTGLAAKLYGLANGIANVAEEDDIHGLNDLADRLERIVAGCDLGTAFLGEDDLPVLSTYLYGNLLLEACLDQAIVPDRQAIKDQLLLLPLE